MCLLQIGELVGALSNDIPILKEFCKTFSE